MTYDLITLAAANIAYVETPLSTSHSQNAAIITNHWKKFNSLLRANQVQLGANWQKFGLTMKINGQYTYRCAYKTDHANPAFNTTTIQAGQFAKFSHVGPISQISTTINQIYKSAIPTHSLDIDINRTLLHFEQYDARFNWNNPTSVVDIYLPLKSNVQR